MFRKYIFITFFSLFSITSIAPAAGPAFMNPQRGALMAGSALSTLAWAYAQHHHSSIAVARYPLMQQRGILNAQLKKETDPEKIEALNQKLSVVTEALHNLHEKRTHYFTIKTASLLVALITALGAYYSPTKAPTDQP